MLGFKLVHRAVFFELFKVFFLAWAALTSLLLLAGLVTEATQHGLGPAQILSAIPLILPNMIPYTLPSTTLFATCIVYGRLAADNEILALKSAGVHIGHAVWPAVLLGLGASVLTLVLYLDIIPSTHHLLRTQFLANVQEYLYGVLRKDGRLIHPKIEYKIFVKQVDGDMLRDAQFMRQDPKAPNTHDVIARAREAKLEVDLDKKIIWVHMYDCWIVDETGQNVLHFYYKAWPVELPKEFLTAEKQRPTDMTWSELFEFRERFLEQKTRADTLWAVYKAKDNQGQLPEDRHSPLAALHAESQMYARRVDNVNTELHMRPALAMGCLCFVLVGCPVGIWFSRSDYLSAFITCFLPIIALYYPLMLSGINLSKAGRVSPYVALWTANALMLVIAALLFRRLARN